MTPMTTFDIIEKPNRGGPTGAVKENSGTNVPRMRTFRIFCCLMTTILLIYYIYGVFVTISNSKTKVTMAKLIKQNPASSHLKSAKDGVLGVMGT